MRYIVTLSLLMFIAGIADAAPLDVPAPEVIAEARAIVQEAVLNPRGPYKRIRWFCNDGTVKKPVAYACKEHGGGRQHAEYSEKRQRLATLGWSVGTIFASLTFEELFNSQPRQQRLRELALERYLIDIDNGWVLRNARAYRGRVQAEDEELAGRNLLLRLLGESSWSSGNFLLVREMARVIPHGEDSDLTRQVRRAAVELAELDATAERWRAEIHSDPSSDTANRLREWLSKKQGSKVTELGGQLVKDLERLYGTAGRRERLDTSLVRLRKAAVSASWRQSIVDALASKPNQRIPELCTALANARATLFPQLSAEARLALIDTMQGLESEVQLTYFETVDHGQMTRTELLGLSRSLVDCSFGAGLLSATEHASLTDRLDVGSSDALSLIDYGKAISRLKRAPAWAAGTVRHTFAEALTRYSALEPRAARFSDDLLRGSPMWMVGDTIKILSKDLDQLSGSVVQIHDRAVASAVALNGGVARGALRIFETIAAVESATLAATDIVVLPETIAELSPVGGILTLGEGNALSHVQLLARNFGIPNVAIDQETVELLRPLENSPVILVVDNIGNVVLRLEDEATTRTINKATASATLPTEQITVPAPDLSMTRVLPLAEIRRAQSGKIIGPKAANLGELNYLFPGRVAPAVAIPFGIYAEHLKKADLMERIRTVFAAQARGEIDKPQFDSTLADVRSQITALEISGASRTALLAAMRAEFGEPGTYGVFVRSDTNVEDLPQFTGAGLNETIPNVVGLDAQLTAVPRVWSSVFSPRALAWRSSVLKNPDQIYASVLLMKSVPATKSGVLVTANLFDRSVPALTASVAWGVGGAVAGEPAESVVIYTDSTEVYSEAKSPYQRKFGERGSVAWVPAAAGPVLTPGEVEVLRELAREVNAKYAPVYNDAGEARPWDIEFGFVDGELALFQIRPLVEKQNRNAGTILRLLLPQKRSKSPKSVTVRLGEVPGK